MVRMRRPQQLAVALALAAPLSVCGCAHVAPYERGALARPDLAAGDVAGPAERHVVSVHEGAARGGAFAESGCGCN